MAYAPTSETLTGADFSGSQPDTDRTYVLAYDTIESTIRLFVQGNSLQLTEDFTFNSTTNTITILSALWDNMPVYIAYALASSPSGSSYATTLQTARFTGIGNEVQSEELGTGDSSEDSYDIDNGNIIASSYTVFYAADGSNDITSMTEATHYTLDKDKGLVLLTTAGVALLSTNKLFITYTYSPKQSNTVLETYLAPAEKEVDKLTANYWGVAKESIQYFDGYTSGYPQTDRPFGEQIEAYPEFEIDYKGIQSITSVLFLDRQGNTDTTLETTQYRLITDDPGEMDGRVLVNTAIPNGKANIKVTFQHGYDEVPALIQELTSLIAGKMALVNISGGSYKDISTYSVGRKSFSIGQIYVNIANSITQLQKRIDGLVEDLGNRYEMA